MVALMSLLFALSFDTLSYSNMSCDDAQTLIDRVYEYQQQSEFISLDDANEIVEVVKESVPECFNEGSK
jgi:hypothetical protein